MAGGYTSATSADSVLISSFYERNGHYTNNQVSAACVRKAILVQAQRECRRLVASLGIQHDLAEHLAVFHVFVGRAGLAQGKGPVHNGL